MLNRQFQSVFTIESNNDLPDKGNSPFPTISQIQINEFGIRCQLQRLKVHKATGPDNISARFLKETSYVIAPILTHIFQVSLSTGNIPNDWKEASIAPVFKRGSRNDPSNYRPISLTSVISKIMEHVIASNIMSHLEKNHIITPVQHGFRCNHSCDTQLVGLLYDLTNSYDHSTQSDLILLDLAKAFDTVPHRRLLYKLSWYGIRGQTLQWIESFLTNRYQKVVVENTCSNKVPVISGVPQGTVLGPILFLMFINDLPDIIVHSNVRLFADDCILYKQISCIDDAQKLQTDLASLYLWAETWQMKFNTSKCHVMHITQAILHKVNFTYSLGEVPLTAVEKSKYLGVTIQSDLKWKSHILDVSARANRTLSLLRRNIRYTSPTIRELSYFTLVRPLLEYACSVWCPWLLQDINQLEKIQCRAARFVVNDYSYHASVTEMINTLGWSSLEQRRYQLQLCLFYKMTHLTAAANLEPFNLQYHPPRHYTRSLRSLQFLVPSYTKN